jgi:hypothetical protein
VGKRQGQRAGRFLAGGVRLERFIQVNQIEGKVREKLFELADIQLDEFVELLVSDHVMLERMDLHVGFL